VLGKNCKRIKWLLNDLIGKYNSDCLLLSGGLDSSILASVFRPASTITMALGKDASDLVYAKQIANRFSTFHKEIVLTTEELLEIMKQVIILFRTFDPIEIRNSSVSFAGITKAKQEGYYSVMTGDGADELFAGYNYLQKYYLEEYSLKEELERLWQIMHFSSFKIGDHLGIEISTPFLDDHFIRLAKSIPTSMKIGYHNGKRCGKYILRKCFEPDLGKGVTWRSKFAQEKGAGISKIENYFNAAIDNKNFNDGLEVAKTDGVNIRSKEHLFYYSVFKNHFGPPKNEVCDLPRCTQCHSCFPWKGKFCRRCGAYPIIPLKP
jgi:asparagine synthase (glutamine-hydrolysing)